MYSRRINEAIEEELNDLFGGKITHCLDNDIEEIIGLEGRELDKKEVVAVLTKNMINKEGIRVDWGVINRQNGKNILVWKSRGEEDYIRFPFLPKGEFGKRDIFCRNDGSKSKLEYALKAVAQRKKDPENIIQKIEESEEISDLIINHPEQFFDGYIEIPELQYEAKESDDKEDLKAISNWIIKEFKDNNKADHIYMGIQCYPHTKEGKKIRKTTDCDILVYNKVKEEINIIEITFESGKEQQKIIRFFQGHNYLSEIIKRRIREKLGEIEVKVSSNMPEIKSILFAPHFKEEKCRKYYHDIFEDYTKYVTDGLPKGGYKLQKMISNGEIQNKIREELNELLKIVK